MSKSKPKTIADLKFNWKFGNDFTCAEFQQLNPKLIDFRIKEGNYQFIIGDHKFEVDCFYSRPIRYFFQDIVELSADFIHGPSKLVKFELIAENTFKIHVKN